MSINYNNNALIEYLCGFITEQRKELFDRLIELRTDYMCIVLEDIFQPHNASAVLRTCDCFGVQNVHIIENSNTYEINPDVVLGSAQWLNLFRHNSQANNTADTLVQLKQQGYRIVATTPKQIESTLENFDIHCGKFALCFGSELPGLTETALQLADEHIYIPMYGFTESLNISVSAAICTQSLMQRIRNSNISWHLPDEEKTKVYLQWLRNTIKAFDSIVDQYLKKTDSLPDNLQ